MIRQSFGTIGYLCAFGTITLISLGCVDQTPKYGPHDIWMTYRDGPLPDGDNLYFDSSDKILNGDVHAKRYEDYAFVEIVGNCAQADRKCIKRYLVNSVEQCQIEFSDAYRRGRLRQVAALRNTSTANKGLFKPKYLVFMVATTRPSYSQRPWTSEADFGIVLRTDHVLAMDSSPKAVVDSAKIVESPQQLQEPSKTGPELNYWRDMKFRVIEEFEDDLKSKPSPPR